MPNGKNVPAFSSFLCRYRKLVERFFDKIKHFRAIATRYDKDSSNYLASVKFAALCIWLQSCVPTTSTSTLIRPRKLGTRMDF